MYQDLILGLRQAWLTAALPQERIIQLVWELLADTLCWELSLRQFFSLPYGCQQEVRQ